MCEVWPGPRCSHDMGKKVEAREKTLLEKKATHGIDSNEYLIAQAKLDYARDEWYATPKGIEELSNRPRPFTRENHEQLERARRTRTMQSNALKEIQNGRLSKIAQLNNALSTFYDTAEVESVIEASREYHEHYALDKLNESIEQATTEEYHTALNTLRENIINETGSITKEQAQLLHELSKMSPPDKLNLKAYLYAPKAIDRSQKSLRNELGRVADLQGVSRATAQAYYEAYRDQYKQRYINKPELERPDPPDSWVRGDLPRAGYTQDPNSAFAPRDAASIYAIYRLRSDDEAIPDFLKTSRPIASIDLETASPQVPGDRNIGFDPEYGRIIEVGVVSYNPKGKPLTTYNQLVKPEQTFLDQHGTGAADVHHISAQDIKNAPSWQQVIPSLRKTLEGKTILAQNAKFETNWLGYHMPGFKEENYPVVDTLDIARKHLDLPNYQLKTICGSVGVAYTAGHRAQHDAEVAGDAYFELKKYIKKTWNAKPARKNAAPLKELPLGSRWDTWRPLIPYRRTRSI